MSTAPTATAATAATFKSWEHGYTTGYGLAMSPIDCDPADDSHLTTQGLAEQIAAGLGIVDPGQLAAWREGVDDAIRDIAEDRFCEQTAEWS